MPPKVGPYRLTAALLIVAAAVLRLLYLAFDCPLDLAPDEAHYWDWSRHLDWSYYSKGPLVAWLIRLSCALFGDWSYALTGNEALAVRLPAAVCCAVFVGNLSVPSVQFFQPGGPPFGVFVFALSSPPVAAGCPPPVVRTPHYPL